MQWSVIAQLEEWRTGWGPGVFATLRKAITAWGEGNVPTNFISKIRIGEERSKFKAEKEKPGVICWQSLTWLILATGCWSRSARPPWEQHITQDPRFTEVCGEALLFPLPGTHLLEQLWFLCLKRYRKELGGRDQTSGHHKTPPP